MSETVEELLAKARQAQAVVEFWSQAQVDRMVASVGWALYREDNAVACARLAYEETEMGVYEDKLLKHRKKTLGTLRDLQNVKSVGVVEVDEERGLMKVAKPVGVVGAITPVTNPTSTPSANGLAILKGRNAVIFAPHPRAKRSTALVVQLMREGLARVGAPVDLIQLVGAPSKESAQKLMESVDLVVATGSGALVRAAYGSGTPAYGVGAGNAVCVVDETADIVDAAHKIGLSKTFDNASSCSSENSLVAERSVFDALMSALQLEGGYLCSETDREKLRNALWPDGTSLNADVVAQPVTTLAALAGIQLPPGSKFLIVEGRDAVESDPFAREKLSLVLTAWRCDAFADAIELVERITRLCGYGHSCGIHSSNEAHIHELALGSHVSRILVNQSQCYGNSGNYDNGLPFSMTLGCGTWGGNISNENICWKHFLNITWVSKPIPPDVPDEKAIFGEHWNEFGK